MKASRAETSEENSYDLATAGHGELREDIEAILNTIPHEGESYANNDDDDSTTSTSDDRK